MRGWAAGRLVEVVGLADAALALFARVVCPSWLLVAVRSRPSTTGILGDGLVNTEVDWLGLFVKLSKSFGALRLSCETARAPTTEVHPNPADHRLRSTPYPHTL